MLAPVLTCNMIVFIFIDATLLMIASIFAFCLSTLRPEVDGKSEAEIHTALISVGSATLSCFTASAELNGATADGELVDFGEDKISELAINEDFANVLEVLFIAEKVSRIATITVNKQMAPRIIHFTLPKDLNKLN